MVQTYTAFRDSVEAELQDSSNANFSTAELDIFIAQACREAGRYVPHVRQVSFSIESRAGTASSTSSGNLVDATESQFVSGDVGKIVYNTTDKTWAVIKTYTSATTVALSKNIMASGENYEIYNAGCTQNNQISLSNIDDYLDIERVEYPIGTPRNWEIDGTVLTIKASYIPDSKVLSSGTQPDTEVLVWFKKCHLISQLTDLLGAVNNAPGYVAGDTSMAINGLQSSGTIETGQEFTIANTRGIYTVTADATIAANAATITFFPGLESAVANTVVITFTGSTLTPTLEPLVQELSAGLASASKPMNLYQHAFSAVTAIALTTTAIAAVAARITQSVTDVVSGRTALTLGVTAISEADTELDKMVTAMDLAKTALASGLTIVNTIPVGGGAPEFMGQAAADIGEGQSRMINGQAYLQKASADNANAAEYFAAAGRELEAGRVKIEEGNASINKAAMELRVASSGREMQVWAQTHLMETRAKLRRLVPAKYHTSKVYSRS